MFSVERVSDHDRTRTRGVSSVKRIFSQPQDQKHEQHQELNAHRSIMDSLTSQAKMALAQQLWTRFLVLLKEKCTSCYRLRLSECLILFNIDDSIKTKNVFDFILLLAKQYLLDHEPALPPRGILPFLGTLTIKVHSSGCLQVSCCCLCLWCWF